MKFLVAVKKNGKNLLRFEDEKGNKIWAVTTEAVIKYAKTNFEEGDECGLEYTIDDNEQYNVTRINKDGKSTTAKATKTQDIKEPKCVDCGKVLKDDKYKKCYPCNQKNPEKKTGGGYSKSPEDKEQIKKLAIIRSANIGIQVLAGHIGDVNVLADMIDTLAKKLYQTYDNLNKK